MLAAAPAAGAAGCIPAALSKELPEAVQHYKWDAKVTIKAKRLF